MPFPLLATKLYIPKPRKSLVHRPRLIERLDQGLYQGSKLTLVSAPAGYGKTTLIADWIHKAQSTNHDSHFTWLSLDEADNDVTRFFTYLIAALQEIDQAIGAELQPILETDADLPMEPLLTALVNDIAAWGADSRPGSRLVLVLDDYHLINEFSIHEALDFLIDHIPPCMRLVILTRADPPMPLGRLRVQQALLEIREVDLQFTADEATTFLNSLMGLDLSAEDINALKARTEGWIAGLQLAALTLQGRADKHDQIAVFSGSHRHLVDYLTHEVMSRQSKEVQSFLLLTSILEQFNASLCDAVLGIGEWGLGAGANLQSPNLIFQSREILDQLEVANLFLIALDDDRQWYRYHPLFADFLDQRLRKTQPAIIPDLFIRASQWYEAQGLLDEAIEYAFEGGGVNRAAKLLNEYAETLFMVNAEVDKILRWAKRLPEDTRAQFPRLCIYHAWALQFEFQLEYVETALAMAERHLAEPSKLSKSFSADQITGHANAVRAYTAQKRGELERSVELSLAALKTLPDEDTKEVLILRGAITLGLGMGYLDLGHMKAANQAFQEALPLNQMTGSRYAALSCVYMLMNVAFIRGALNEAQANGERGQLWIDEWSRRKDRGRRPARMLAYIRQEIGLVQYERNKLNQSVTNLKKACDYFDLARSWLRLDAYAYLVDVYQAIGEVNRALDYLRKLKRLSLGLELSLTPIPVGAILAQRNLLLSQSRPDLDDLLAEAVSWAKSSGLEPTDRFRYKQEYEYRTLARVLIAQQRAEEAVPLLDRLIISAEDGGRNGHLITYLSLRAVAHYSLGKTDLALTHLSRAIALAEPEGYIRTFIDLGPPMRDLLQLATGKDISPTYVTKLLAAFPVRPLPGRGVPESQAEHRSARPSIPVSQIEPLNDRELQILRLMSGMLSNREIADELYLSVNTIKWYARSIYDKLGVANRREAGSRARELRIL